MVYRYVGFLFLCEVVRTLWVSAIKERTEAWVYIVRCRPSAQPLHAFMKHLVAASPLISSLSLSRFACDFAQKLRRINGTAAGR